MFTILLVLHVLFLRIAWSCQVHRLPYATSSNAGSPQVASSSAQPDIIRPPPSQFQTSNVGYVGSNSYNPPIQSSVGNTYGSNYPVYSIKPPPPKKPMPSFTPPPQPQKPPTPTVQPQKPPTPTTQPPVPTTTHYGQVPLKIGHGDQMYYGSDGSGGYQGGGGGGSNYNAGPPPNYGGGNYGGGPPNYGGGPPNYGGGPPNYGGGPPNYGGGPPNYGGGPPNYGGGPPNYGGGPPNYGGGPPNYGGGPPNYGGGPPDYGHSQSQSQVQDGSAYPMYGQLRSLPGKDKPLTVAEPEVPKVQDDGNKKKAL